MSGTVGVAVRMNRSRVQRQISGSRTRGPSAPHQTLGRPAAPDAAAAAQYVRDHEAGTRGGGLRHGPRLVLDGHARHRLHLVTDTQHLEQRVSPKKTVRSLILVKPVHTNCHITQLTSRTVAEPKRVGTNYFRAAPLPT